MPVYNNELFTLQLFLFFTKNEIFKFFKENLAGKNGHQQKMCQILVFQREKMVIIKMRLHSF